VSTQQDLYAPKNNDRFDNTASTLMLESNTIKSSIGGVIGVREMQGTLSSRIRSLTCDVVEGMTQHEWRAKAIEHPAYPLIFEELKAAHDFKILDKVMDQLEALGCIVTYDRSTAQLTVGLNINNLCKGFTERMAMVDVRNKRLIDQANGIGPLDRLMEPQSKLEVGDIQISPTYFLTFNLKDDQ